MNINILVYAFLTNLSINSDHTINIDSSTINKDFKTSVKPVYTISKSAVDFQSLINKADSFDFSYNPDLNPLVYNYINNTDIESNHPAVFAVLQMTSLESMVVQYALDVDETYLSGMTINDLNRTRKNLRILADWLGDYDNYQYLVEYIRDNEIALGYAQNKIDIGLNGITLREDTN